MVFVLTTIRIPPPTPPPEGETLWRSMAVGARFVRADRGLRVSVAAMCINTLLAAPFIALVPAMAEKVFDAGPRGTSILVTAQGIGAVSMGIALGALTTAFGIRRVVSAMLVLLPPSLVVYAYAPALPFSALALLFVGAFYLGALSSFFTISQLRAPANLRGRVLAVNNIILGSLYPLGRSRAREDRGLDRAARDDCRRGGADGGCAARRAPRPTGHRRRARRARARRRVMPAR